MATLINRLLRDGLRGGGRTLRKRRCRESTFSMGEPRMNLDKALGLAAALEDEEAEQAIIRVESWMDHPNAKLVQEQADHWAVLRDLLGASGTAGNLTSDAHLAALAVSHGCTLASCDNDFSRFAGLRWTNPLGNG